MWYLKLRHLIMSLLKDESGSNAVEFATVAPVVLLIVLGIMQFGMIFFTYNNMVQAAREATRTLAVQETTAAEAQTIALNQLAFSGLPFTVTICEPATVPCASDPLSSVSVTIAVPLSEATIVDILGLFSTGDLEATVTMRKEAV